jgi:selenide,water dikinase
MAEKVESAFAPPPFRLSQAATTGGCAAKIGPGDLSEIVRPLLAGLAPHPDVIVGAETGDDAGVFRFAGRGLIATTDFIPPLCDDPFRFGRIAAANALSDVFAMGGEALFALNLSLFPSDAPKAVLTGILEGAASACAEAGAALLGGHSVKDKELKFGLAVVGVADPDRLLTNAGARPGDRLILTKPLGSGVLVNAFKHGKCDEATLEPALAQMERLNLAASRLALAHGATAATDVTGFGLAGHAWNVARESKLRLRIRFAAARPRTGPTPGPT